MILIENKHRFKSLILFLKKKELKVEKKFKCKKLILNKLD